MIDRARLLSRLERKEKLELFVYDDKTGRRIIPGSIVEGNPTVGIGRNMFSRGLTPDECRYLANNDIDLCLELAERALAWFGELDPIRQEVILEMLFNMGLVRFLGFGKTIEAIALKDYAAAAAEMLSSRWEGQVGDRAIELADMMRTGVHNPG